MLHIIPVSWKCGTSILVVSLEHIGRTVVDQLDVFGQTVGLDCLGKSMEPKKIVEVLIIIENVQMPLERAEKRESTAIEVTCNTINDELIELF